MIDCKIAENYLKERLRMCKSINCKDCALERYGCSSPQTAEDIQRCINTVQAWSNSHKTYLSDFLEKYPNAPTHGNGYPRMCPSSLGYAQERECLTTDETSDCVACWNTLLADEL